MTYDEVYEIMDATFPPGVMEFHSDEACRMYHDAFERLWKILYEKYQQEQKAKGIHFFFLIRPFRGSITYV